MALLAKACGDQPLSRSRSLSHLRPALGAGAPLSTACRSMWHPNRRRPSTSSSTDRPTRCARSPRATGCASRKRCPKAPCCRRTQPASKRCAAEVDHLSRDVEVTSFMSVSNAAIGADQVQAGLEGLSQFTGAGIGVALIDSGVWTGHRSLAGRVVYSKDFVGDGATVRGKGDPVKTPTATARTSARPSRAARRIRRTRPLRHRSAASRPAPISSACA